MSSNITDFLTCPICSEFAANAVMSQCCTIIYCEQCVPTNCPKCHLSPFVVKPDILARKMMKSPAKCECGSDVALGDLKEHRVLCSETIQKCVRNDCGYQEKTENFLLHILNIHKKELIEDYTGTKKTEIENMTKSRDYTQNGKSKFADEIGNLRNDCEESEIKICSLSKRNKDLETSLEEMKYCMNSVNSKNKKQVANLKREIEELHHQLLEQVNIQEDKEKEIMNLRRDIATLKCELDMNEDESARSKKSNSTLKQQLDKFEEHINVILKKTKNLEKEKSKLESYIRDIQLQLDDEIAKSNDLERKNKELLKKCKSLEAEMDNSVSALKTDIECQLQKTLEELRVAEEYLEKSMRDQKEAAKDKANLSCQLQDVQAELYDTVEAKSRLERQNRALLDEIETLREEIENNIADKFEELKNSHSQAIEGANRNAQMIEDKYKKVTTENKAIRIQLEEALSQLDAAYKAKQTAEEMAKLAQLEIDDLQGRCEDEEANSDELRSEKTIAEMKLSETRNNLRIVEEEKTRLECSLRNSLAEIQQIQSQLQTSETDKNILERKYKNLQAQYDEAGEAQNNAKRNIQKAERKTKKAEKQVKMAREDADRERSLRSQDQAKISSLENELRSLRSQLVDEQSNTQQAQSQRRKVETDLQSIHRELATAKQQLEEAREDMERERKRSAKYKKSMASMFD